MELCLVAWASSAAAMMPLEGTCTRPMLLLSDRVSPHCGSTPPDNVCPKPTSFALNLHRQGEAVRSPAELGGFAVTDNFFQISVGVAAAKQQPSAHINHSRSAATSRSCSTVTPSAISANRNLVKFQKPSRVLAKEEGPNDPGGIRYSGCHP